MTQQGEMPPPLIASLFISLFFIVMSFTLTAIASPYIVSDLGGDRYISTYGLSFFGFGTALTVPLAKPLGIRFGIRKMFCLSLCAFALTALLSAFSPTYFWFICARTLTGMAIGPFYSLLAHSFSTMAYTPKFIPWTFVTILIVTPVIGACFGGSVAYLYTWQAALYFNAAAAFILIPIVHNYLKDAKIPPMQGGFDWIGWTFYAVGIFALSFVIATAQQLDWYRSNIIVSAFLIGLVSFGYFLIRSFTHTTPVLDLRLFAKPIFSLALLCLAVLFGVYFGVIILLATWLTLDARFTPIWIAILIGHMGIAGLFPRFILEEKMGKIDPRIYLACAASLLAISCFYTTIFDVEINFGRIAFSRIIAGFGLALFLPPIFQILSHSFAHEKWVDIFQIFQGIRNISCGLGVAIFSTIWQRRTVFYHERLNEKLNLQSHPFQVFHKKTELLHVQGDPLAYLNEFLDRRASSLALDDVFYLMGWILIGLLVLLLLTFVFKKEAFDLSKAQYISFQNEDKL